MQMTEITYDSQPPVDAYGPGYFRVKGQVQEGPILITAGGVMSWAGYADWAGVLTEAATFDVLFVGTGAEIAHLPKDAAKKLEAAGIHYEVMQTPAACRTYNILLSEKRRVALAVLPV